MAQQVRLYNNRSIKLRRVVQFNNSTSLGLIIPKTFAEIMRLEAGDYIACEFNEEKNSITLNKCSIEEDDNA